MTGTNVGDEASGDRILWKVCQTTDRNSLLLGRARPDDVDRERDTPMQGQFAVDGAEVPLDGFGADAKFRGNLTVGQSPRHGFGDLALAGRV